MKQEESITLEVFFIFFIWWAGKDSNLRRRTPSDLQSDAFGHFATDPQIQAV